MEDREAASRSLLHTHLHLRWVRWVGVVGVGEVRMSGLVCLLKSVSRYVSIVWSA